MTKDEIKTILPHREPMLLVEELEQDGAFALGKYRVKGDERLMFAGQITGVEGYVESTASGCLAALELARRIEGKPPIDFPQETAIGALALYISHEGVENFQPMNVNFGIMPPLGYRVKGKRNKNAALSQRALEALDGLDWR